ncbi:MAG: hypothetical protein LBF56_01940 [Holosporales bacterium]|jgi:type VI secretion system protein ImpL|nr:hypothetical protein [Holosporales bacterium]
MNFFEKFIGNIAAGLKNGALPFPVIIGIVLSVAFLAMLGITIFTLISIKRAELKAKKAFNVPPSATPGADAEDKTDPNAPSPWPIGEWLNKFLIGRGYISANSIVKSFFKTLDYLKTSLGDGYKYKLPWYTIIGSSGTGKSSLMNGFTQDEIYSDEGEESPCTWWFLKNGVVLDISGNVFLPRSGFDADENSWNIILNLLSRYRAAKPLNGIILTIDANELYGKQKLAPEELNKRAQYMARKLNFAQNYIGMKLPIYIVVTKTDIIPGFQSFCSEIPVRNRDNMLGWSSPYSIETIYSSKMIDEGFATLENELNELMMEIFSENTVTSSRDGVFVFPSELLAIKHPLAAYIDAIFKSSSTEEKFYLRGFYFTGDSKMIPLPQIGGDTSWNAMAMVGTPDAGINEMGQMTPTNGDEGTMQKKIFFFEDLISKKIFAEEGIATPMRSKIHQANKSIFIAKISTVAFVIIGSYGLFKANDQLQRDKNSIYPSLFKISSMIKDASDLTYRNLAKEGNNLLANYASQLLTMMQQMSNSGFSSIFVPASWFSSIHRDLTETLRASYQRVVVRTIYMNLVLKARELLNMVPKHESNSIAELLNPAASAEYRQLKDYVFGLIELSKNIKKFDSLRTSGDPKDLNELVEYTFHGELPQEFLENYQEFRRILMNTPFPHIDLVPYKQTAYNNLINLFQNYLDTIFTTRAENGTISVLNKFVSKLTRQNIRDKPECREILKFAGDLMAVCKVLGKEGETWLDKPVYEPDSEYDELLDGIETLFGKDVAQKLLDITAINFGYLRAQLAAFNKTLSNNGVSPLKAQTEEPPVTSGIYLIEKCLSLLCSESFMEVPGDYQLITEIPEGKMIFWDDDLVQRAYEMGRQFEQFMATTIKDFPKSMQEGIALISRSNLCALIASTIAKAQSLVDAPSGITPEITSEEILQKQVAELKGVAPRLVNLLTILRGDKFGYVFGNLRSVLNRVGFSLLGHIEKLLENQKPYCPANVTFNYWDGARGAGLAAFSAADTEELLLYLKLQRNMISRLALDFAHIIVEFLNAEIIYDKNYGNQALLSKWTRIVENVQRAAKKDPTSSVLTLEKFIRKTLNEYDLDNITTKMPAKELRGESGDYFLGLMKEIKIGLMTRAEVLIRKRNIERYKSLRDYYVKHIETKYPFSNYDKTQRTAMDADLDAVKSFFKMYDEYGGTPEKILDQIYQLGSDAAAPYEFLKKIHELRLFFGDFFNSQYETLKVKLEINFDVNKRDEQNTEYLVDRVFKPSNEATIEPISQEKGGMWYLGGPIEMDFRWASGDAHADKPTYDQNDPDIILSENTAKIQCVGTWSVLRFLQKYRAESVNAGQLAPNQVLLCFRVPLHTGKIAKIYVGITPTIPKKPGDPSVVSLKVPTTPGKMPELPASVEAVASEAVLISKIRSETPVDTTDNKKQKTSEEPEEPTEEEENVGEAVEIEETVSESTEASTKMAKQDDKERKNKIQDREVKKLLESPELLETEPVIEVTEDAIG